jgi:ADP-ribosyl-[dinitrogen reductase] hydrolase
MRGSCLCKTITYKVDALSGPIGHCHCRTCQKAHSAAFASTARASRDAFRWVTGQERLRAFESSPGKLRHFCSLCGSHLIAEWIAKPYVIVRVASLDDHPGMQPELHIWTAHDVPWLSYGDLPAFPDWPPSK